MKTGRRKRGEYSRQWNSMSKLSESGSRKEAHVTDQNSVAQEETGMRWGYQSGGPCVIKDNKQHPLCGDSMTITQLWLKSSTYHTNIWYHHHCPSVLLDNAFGLPAKQEAQELSYQWPSPTTSFSDNSLLNTGVRILLITKPSQRTQNQSSKFFSGFSPRFTQKVISWQHLWISVSTLAI